MTWTGLDFCSTVTSANEKQLCLPRLWRWERGRGGEGRGGGRSPGRAPYLLLRDSPHPGSPCRWLPAATSPYLTGDLPSTPPILLGSLGSQRAVEPSVGGPLTAASRSPAFCRVQGRGHKGRAEFWFSGHLSLPLPSPPQLLRGLRPP